MNMNMNLLITMGTISIGGAIIERILGRMGKIDEANLIGIASMSILTLTVIGCVIKVFGEIKKL